MAKGSLRVNGIIVDTDGEIKASTGDSIVIREDDGSAVITVDTNGKTSIGGPMDVGVDDTGHDVKFFGATAGKYMEWDESADQLDVTGSFDVTGNSTMVGSLTVGVDDTGHDVKFFGPTSGAYMEWEGENNDRLVLMGATTKLGINEATPALPLHISHSSTNTSVDGNSSSHSAIMLQNTSNTDGNYTGIWNQDADNDATNAAIIFKNVSHSNSTASMHFLTRASGASAAEKMVIDADGKVGIGTSAPGTNLEVAHSGHSNSGAVRIGDPSTISNNTSIYMRTTGVASIGAGGGDIVFDTNIGSAERMRIVHSTGNVGIGTTAPSSMLHLYTTTNTDKLTIESTEAGTSTSGFGINLYRNSASAADNDVMSNIRFIGKNDAGSPEDVTYAQMYSRIIDASDGTEDGALHIQTMKDGSLTSTFTVSGNAVGIMESTPLFSLHVAGTLGIKTAQPTLTFDRGGAYAWTIRNGDGTGSFPLSTLNIVNNAGSPKMTFKDNGYIGISVTSPGVALDVAGAIRATSDITAYHSSDIALKENISPISNALTKLDSLNGVCFDWTDEHINSNGGPHDYFMQKRDVGIIAQELKEVLPEAVRQREDGTLAVKYDGVIPLLIQAIKELKSEINSVRN